jgi:Flp pilus assembly protein TadB
MSTVINFVALVIGTASVGCTWWIVADIVLSKRWSRTWVHTRLAPTSPLVTAHDANHDNTIADFLDAIARDVHSGFSLTLAFVNTADRFPNLAWWTEPIAVQCMRGHSLARAIADTTPTNWTPDVLLATRTLAVASNGGFGIATALEKSASILRERDHIARERIAQTAQIRISTSVLSWIPVVICAWVLTNQPISRQFMFTSPFGVMCLVFGVIFNVGGRLWISRIARSNT